MAKKSTTTTHERAAPFRADFDSVHAYMAWARDGELTNSENRELYNYMATRANDGFHGTALPTTCADIERMVLNGWDEGATRITRTAEQINVPRLPSIKRRRIRGDHGDTLDMGMVYAGALDTAWTRTAKAECSAPPRIRLIANMTTPACTEGADMFWRGAAVLALADALTEAGYSIEIITACNSRPTVVGDTPGRTCMFTAVAKSWQSPMDIATLASVTALAGFFRTFGFLAIAKSADQKLTSSLGHALSVSPSDFPSDAANFVAGDHVNDESAALRWIKSTLDALNPDTAAAA